LPIKKSVRFLLTEEQEKLSSNHPKKKQYHKERHKRVQQSQLPSSSQELVKVYTCSDCGNTSETFCDVIGHHVRIHQVTKVSAKCTKCGNLAVILDRWNTSTECKICGSTTL